VDYDGDEDSVSRESTRLKYTIDVPFKSYVCLNAEPSMSPPVPITEDQNTTTTSTSITIDSVMRIFDERHPVAEVGQPPTGENPFTVDARSMRPKRGASREHQVCMSCDVDTIGHPCQITANSIK